MQLFNIMRKKSRRIKQKKWDNKGMTMVEVLMGFVLLSLMLGMLSQVISFSTSLYQESVQIKWVEENLERYLYKKEIPLSGTGVVATVKELHADAGGNVSIKEATFEDRGVRKSLSTKAGAYTVSSKDFPPVISPEEDPEIVVVIFR